MEAGKAKGLGSVIGIVGLQKSIDVRLMWPNVKEKGTLVQLPTGHCYNYPTQISKILDPTDEETAMSPSPLRATITDVIKSGIDVPAAKNVSPITCKSIQ